MRHFPAALILFLALSVPASACLWYYGKNIKGDPIEVEEVPSALTDFVKTLTEHSDHDTLRNVDLGPEPGANADFKLRSDYAATLLHQGKTKRALAILEAVEKSHPGEYIVAANLGTAYELNGDVDRALTWISEGIQRNPNSHYGTEWLHVRILEAKRELAKDPTWLQSHSVLDFDFGKDVVPSLPAQWGRMGQDAVLTALRYQLRERLAFVSPPDPIVGELISVYADYIAMTMTVENAIPIYDLALKYKPAHADLVEKRRERAWQQRTPPEPEAFPMTVLLIAGVGLLSASLITLMIRRATASQSR